MQQTACLIGLLLDPEVGSSTFLRNVSISLPDYTTSNQEILVDFEGFWRWCIKHRIVGFLALSKGPTKWCLLLPSPEDGNRSSFRNVVFLLPRTPDGGKVQKPSNPARNISLLIKNSKIIIVSMFNFHLLTFCILFRGISEVSNLFNKLHYCNK
jgi:hypothetical protein